MNKQEFVGLISEKTGLTKKETETFVNAYVDSIAEVLATGDKVQLVGHGTYEAKERAAKPEREGRNPSTGEPMTLPAKPAYLAPTFKAGKKLKEAINL